MYRQPGFVLWSIAVVIVAFAALALAHFLGQTEQAARSEALFIVLLLGLAAVAALWRVARGYRSAAAVPDISQLGVGTILRPQRRKAVAMACVVVAIGAVLLLTLGSSTRGVRTTAWCLVGLGTMLLVLIGAGALPVGQLALREDGLAFGAGQAPLVLPWERIRAVGGGEFGGNPAFFLWIDEPETLPVPASKRAGFLRTVAYSRKMMECDYCQLMTSYGIGVASIVEAIDRHASQRRTASSRVG